MSDIVIDTDIMRSAGSSDHPHSSNARRVLEVIFEANHRMVQCKPIKDEYDKHQSNYAFIWRSKMISKKRWVHWVYKEDSKLRQTLVTSLPVQTVANKEGAIIKDAHLLEAAVATDNRIVSKDARAKKLFRLACPNLGIHRHILWGDLTAEANAVIQWISEGCREHDDFKLCPPQQRRVKRKR